MDRFRWGAICIVLGVLLLVASAGLIGYNLWDDTRAAEQSNKLLEDINANRNKNQPSGATPDYILNPEMEMPTVEIDGYRYIGTITVPTLELELPVMDTWSYPQLKIAPCRYAGSPYKKNFIIAAHNYNSHFGQLRTLQVGDEISFTDMDGNKFTYIVAKQDELAPTEVEKMTTSNWDMTLFTCTLSGRTRVTVRCTQVESISDE